VALVVAVIQGVAGLAHAFAELFHLILAFEAALVAAGLAEVEFEGLNEDGRS
jgi:hypothetical protein